MLMASLGLADGELRATYWLQRGLPSATGSIGDMVGRNGARVHSRIRSIFRHGFRQSRYVDSGEAAGCLNSQCSLPFRRRDLCANSADRRADHRVSKGSGFSSKIGRLTSGSSTITRPKARPRCATRSSFRWSRLAAKPSFDRTKTLTASALSPNRPTRNTIPTDCRWGSPRLIVKKGRWKGEWAGLTCAACHSAELEYKGRKIRVSGRHQRQAGLACLHRRTERRIANHRRRRRQIRADGRAARQANSGREGRTASAAACRCGQRLALSYTDGFDAVRTVGPGRVDALALIHNNVMATQVGIRENWRPPLAPVKYSFVWNFPQSAWAQWSGVAARSDIA